MIQQCECPPLVVAVGPVPPPLHGAAATTQAMIDYMRTRLPVHVANSASGTGSGILKHLVKATRVVRAMLWLAGKARSNPVRVLYLAADGQRGLIYNILVAATARALGYSILVHHHSFAYIDRYSALMAFLSRVLGRAGTQIVLCGAMADGLRARYKSLAGARMVELSSAAFLEPAPRQDQRKGEGIQIGFLSNLIIEKGVDTCIDLLRACLREGLQVRLLLAGKAPDARAEELVNAAISEFGPAIAYLGPLTDDEKVEFFRKIDVFAFPSRYVNEAQPRAVLEALAFAVPVLTIARSCIAGDVGEGCGMCASQGEDFVTQVMPLVREWCSDRNALLRSSEQASARAAVLYSTGQRQLTAIVDMIAEMAAAPSEND